MKYSILLFIFCFNNLGGTCQIESNTDKTLLNETFNCIKGEMKSEWYEEGINETIPKLKNIMIGFMILVDTNNKATNYISEYEEYLRKLSNPVDTSSLRFIRYNQERVLSVQEINEKLAELKIKFQRQADSVHIENNQGQNQIWIINNSLDTVSVQLQDYSFICILQGLSKGGQWFPIQYWKLSNCGNSFTKKYFPPGIANSFITRIPKNGDYETKLRFKLLGTNKFYYSNEFTGKINECDFVEDMTQYIRPQYKLEYLVNLCRFER